MQRPRGVKQRERCRPTPTQKTGSEPPPTSRHGRKLSNPQHFTLQGTQRMDFTRQGNGAAVQIDRRPNVRFGSKADILLRPIDVRYSPESRHLPC
jgi:hypothetical protein